MQNSFGVCNSGQNFSPMQFANLRISVKFYTCQYVVKLLPFCWITGGLIICPPIEAQLPVTGITVPQFSLQTIRLHYLHATVLYSWRNEDRLRYNAFIRWLDILCALWLLLHEVTDMWHVLTNIRILEYFHFINCLSSAYVKDRKCLPG